MGILASEKTKESPVATRRKSMGLDLSALKPLNAQTGTKNFAGYREKEAKAKRNEDAMDSDDDEDDARIKEDDVDDEVDSSKKALLSPEDARREGELEEGVRKIKVSTFYLPIYL
jgi:hypothetical protein